MAQYKIKMYNSKGEVTKTIISSFKKGIRRLKNMLIQEFKKMYFEEYERKIGSAEWESLDYYDFRHILEIQNALRTKGIYLYEREKLFFTEPFCLTIEKIS